MCLLASFTLPRGPTAALLAAPWLLYTLWIAFLGILRLRATGFRRMEEVSIAAGLVFLAVGGAWTVVSRYGLDLTALQMELVNIRRTREQGYKSLYSFAIAA